MKQVLIITVSSFLVSALSATAQDTLRVKDEALSELVVTATGTPHTLKNVPVQTEVVSRRQIEQLGAAQFEDILSTLCPGFDFNPGDMGSQMTMNGLGNSYILVLVDGKRLHGDNGGENDLSLIDPINIDHIEIVRGAGSALYGSDAIAGVINVITRKHDEGILLENTTRGGMYGDWRQHNGIGLRKGNWASYTNFQLQHSNGWQNTPVEDPAQTEFYITDSQNKTVNKYTNYQIAERLTWQPCKNLEFYADGSYYWKRIYRPTNGHYPSCDVTTYDLMYHNSNAAAGGVWKLNKTDRLSLDLDWNKHAYYYRYTATTLEDGYDPQGRFTHYFPYFPGQKHLQSNQQRAMVHLKGIFQLPQSNLLNVGAEYRYDYLEAPTRVKGGQAHDWTASVYAQDEFTLLNWFSLTGGLRLNQNGGFGFRATPKVSAMFRLGEFRLRTGWSQGFKAPTPKELHYRYLRQMGSTEFLYIGNERLKAQTSNYYSASLEWSHRGFSISATGYMNDLNQMITLVNIPLNEVPQGITTEYMGDGSNEIVPRQYQNMEDARSWGGELSLAWRITNEWTVGGGYSYLNTRAHVYDTKHNRLNTVTIDGMAHHKGNVYATWLRQFSTAYRLGLGLYGRASSKRFYQNNGNGRAYQIWRLTTTHDLGRNRRGITYRLEAGVDNILNFVDRTPHGLHLGTTSPGRTVYGTFTIRFTQGRKIALAAPKSTRQYDDDNE
ncbi:MAG: TonB-dependent receptor [Bacteroidaceae bacterium]|nr:TonB-dependent receptor [Bacteroidaceae bacterium]